MDGQTLMFNRGGFMEKLKFKAICIPCYSDIKRALNCSTKFVLPEDECIWCLDSPFVNESNCRFFCCQEWDDYLIPSLHRAYEIYPMLYLLNLKNSGFRIGDTFDVKGLKFLIFDELKAIAMQSIGSFAWEDDEYLPFSSPAMGVYIYNMSSLQELVQDWYNYFIQDAIVAKKRLEHREDILKYYDIMPMPGVLGRYHIVNKSGRVRHNARGHGFTSQEKARNMLLEYASKEPIPQEDIDAYEKHDERI